MNILVIGDAMLDTYLYGDVSRVSPEAPIPVVCPTLKEDRPGGAANVACNAATLGAQVTAIFLLGADEQADRLLGKLRVYGVNAKGAIRDTKQRTINKVRLVGNGQQIVRIDYNDRYALDDATESALLNAFQEVVASQDVIILSDYGKGTCTESLCHEVIRRSRELDKPVVVDPKGTDWEKYRGAFIITPNMKELNLFAGLSVSNDDAAIENAYRGICQKLGIRYLLLTRSDKGMTLLHDDEVLHIPTQAREVNDVSGAGDTVVAALALQLAKDHEAIEDAVRFANAAAGIVVGKRGTATVTADEVPVSDVDENPASEETGIYTWRDMEALRRTLSRWRAAGDTIVTTNGCFDVLHVGHLKVLRAAKQQGDRLIVAINADAAVKRLKGAGRPINGEMDRAQMLLSQRMVDAVVIFDPKEEPVTLTETERGKLTQKALAAVPEAPMAVLRHIRPDVHVKGGDYKAQDVPEAIYAKRLVLVPFLDGYSTTKTLQHMKNE